jgi:hypothetical protein
MTKKVRVGSLIEFKPNYLARAKDDHYYKAEKDAFFAQKYHRIIRKDAWDGYWIKCPESIISSGTWLLGKNNFNLIDEQKTPCTCSWLHCKNKLVPFSQS